MSASLSQTDIAALGYLAGGHTTATHHVARACGFDRTDGHRSTAKARTLLLRLERHGLTQRHSGSAGRAYWWKITEAGRAAITQGELA